MHKSNKTTSQGSSKLSRVRVQFIPNNGTKYDKLNKDAMFMTSSLDQELPANVIDLRVIIKGQARAYTRSKTLLFFHGPNMK